MATISQDEKQTYEEWKEFLQSDRDDVKLAATEAAVIQLAAGTKKNCYVFSTEKHMVQQGLVALLAKNASHKSNAENESNRTNDSSNKISLLALQALVHLSSTGLYANQAVDDLLQQSSGVQRMLEIVLESPRGIVHDKQQRRRVHYAMALLANLTRTEQGSVQLVGFSFPEHAVIAPSSSSSTPENDSAALMAPAPTTLHLLLSRFLNPQFFIDTVTNDDRQELEEKEDNKDETVHVNDPYEHFATILMNVTQVERGRQFVLRSSISAKNTVLEQLFPELRSKNSIRCRGIAGTIRNCCLGLFDLPQSKTPEKDATIISEDPPPGTKDGATTEEKDDEEKSKTLTTKDPSSDVTGGKAPEKDSPLVSLLLNKDLEMSKHLLYPLAGPEDLDLSEKQGLHPDLWLEGPDKKRATDEQTRLFLVETLQILLASSVEARKRLRVDRAYIILKYADMVEESEAVSAKIEDCVQFLRRDEEGTTEGSSDQFVEDTYRKMTSATAAVNLSEIDDDDEDLDGID